MQAVSRFWITLACCLWAGMAVAATPLNYTATLYFTWARIPLGQLTLSMQQEGTRYAMTTSAKTEGIALLFNRHHSLTTAEGRATSPDFLPQHYRSDYTDNGEKRLIALEYDAQGMPQTETIIPPREEIRPLVPQEMKQGAVDILTGFFVMRERLRAALRQRPAQPFSVTIYDGKRLFRMDATVDKPLVTVKFHGIRRPAIQLALQRVPLAGYKDKELRKLKARNPRISLYVEPERLVPFGVSLPVYGATLEGWIKPER